MESDSQFLWAVCRGAVVWVKDRASMSIYSKYFTSTSYIRPHRFQERLAEWRGKGADNGWEQRQPLDFVGVGVGGGEDGVKGERYRR